jgi:hypothetical protein
MKITHNPSQMLSLQSMGHTSAPGYSLDIMLDEAVINV